MFTKLNFFIFISNFFCRNLNPEINKLQLPPSSVYQVTIICKQSSITLKLKIVYGHLRVKQICIRKSVCTIRLTFQ